MPLKGDRMKRLVLTKNVSRQYCLVFKRILNYNLNGHTVLDTVDTLRKNGNLNREMENWF